MGAGNLANLNNWEPGKPEPEDPIRYPLATPFTNRNTTINSDGYLKNLFTETDPYGELWVSKRPGLENFNFFSLGTSSQGIVSHKGLLYAASGNGLYRITASADGYSGTGAAWAAIAPINPWTTRTEFDVVEFNGKLWLASGRDTGFLADYLYADVWASEDGEQWVQVVARAPWSKRTGAKLVKYNNELYLIGGAEDNGAGLVPRNDVWKSSNGLDWEQMTTAAAFPARINFEVVSFNNGMFLLGGFNNVTATTYSDVWYSTDGITWSQVAAGAAFGARQLFSACVFKGKLWVYGGWDAGGLYLDTLYASTDGKIFTLQNAAVTGAGRINAQMVVYRDIMWLVGGVTGGFVYSSQVFNSNSAGTIFALVTAAPGWAAGYFNGLVVFPLPSSISPTRQTSMIAIGRVDAASPAAGASNVYYASLNIAVAASFSIPSAVTEDLAFQEQNHGQYLLMKDSNGLYVFDQNMIVQVTDPNYPGNTVFGLAVLDDTAYVMDLFGVIYGSDLSNPFIWNSLNFLTAEYEADAGVRIVKYLNYICAMKENTIQFFYDAGNAQGSPLMPVRNATSRVGCAIAKSVATISNTLIWVGRTNTNELNVFMLDGFKPIPIGDPFICRLLENITIAADCRAWSVLSKGHNFYVITFYGYDVTLVFDLTTKTWHRWTSTTGARFPANFYATDQDYNYLLDDSVGRIYKLSPTTFGDNGSAIPCEAVTNIIDGGTDLYKFFGRVNLIADTGCGDVEISWTDTDYASFSTARIVNTDATDQARRCLYRLGRSRRRAFKVYNNTSNKPFRAKALEFFINMGTG